jgi:signal transduction histidine kinase
MKTHEQFQSGDNPALLVPTRRPVEFSTAVHESTGDVSGWRAMADCEERLHAVRSGLSAVSAALYVLLDAPPAAAGSRDVLGATLVAEVERLKRMVAPPAPAYAMVGEELELDSVVGGVVMARRLAGQEIAWTPSGGRVVGRADDIAEVLNILVVNAWRHAQGAPARIDVAVTPGRVLVTVSDDGPGVPPELHESIFERGVRRPGSRGQGLGLAMARDLVVGLGGTLALSPTTVGARFCIVLPTVQQGDDA